VHNHKNLFFFILSFAFTGLMVLAIFNYKSSINLQLINKKIVFQKKEMPKPYVSPEMIIKDFSIQENLKNKDEVLILNSEEGRVFRKSNQIECKNLSCNLFRKETQIAKLESKTSLVDRDKKIVFLQEKVTGNFYDLKFEGKDLNYDFSNQTITTKQPLNYAYPNLNFVAKQSTFDLKENKIEMNDGVRCEILR